MKSISLLLIILSQNILATEIPQWVNSPSDYCGKAKLCVVGEASGRMMAETEARNSMAKVFESKIISTTTATTTSESKIKEDVVTGTVEESFSSQIKEITEQTLEGVIVEKFFEDEESYFALAVLDRKQAAARLREKMATLDDEIYDLYQRNKRASINKALNLFKFRDILNEKHFFLVERDYSAKVPKTTLLSAKRKKAQERVVIYLKIDELSETNELRNYVIENFLENDLKVVTVPTLAHQYIVNVTLSGEKQHMNVKGFEKYKFLLNFESSSSKGKKIGGLNFTHVETGRNLTQAYQKTFVKIKTYIKNNLGQLNID